MASIIKGLNPEIILENRRKIAQGLIRKYNFTEADLANFFYMNPSVMGKFLKERGIEPGVEQTAENKSIADSLRIQRDKKVRRASEDEIVSVLEKNGLWQIPEIKTIQVDNLQDIPNENDAKQAMEFLQFGFTYSDVKSYFHLTQIQLGLMKDELSNQKIPTGVKIRSSRESFETIKDMVRNGHDVKSSVKATGSSLSPENESFFVKSEKKDYSYEEYIDYKNKKREHNIHMYEKADGTVSTYHYKKKNPTHTSSEKQALKEEAFRRWMSAEATQAELAKEYKVDRVTIGNWCREMKVKYRGNISQPTVRRRNLSEKTLRERGLEKYDNPGMMRLTEEPNVPIRAMGSAIKNATDEEKTRLSCISEEIYKKGFGAFVSYGPNKGKSMVDKIVQPGYAQRLADTTKIGIEFSTVEGAREHADAHEGEMKTFWDEKYGTDEHEIE